MERIHRSPRRREILVHLPIHRQRREQPGDHPPEIESLARAPAQRHGADVARLPYRPEHPRQLAGHPRRHRAQHGDFGVALEHLEAGADLVQAVVEGFQLGGLVDDRLGLGPGHGKLLLILAFELLGRGPLPVRRLQTVGDPRLAVGHHLHHPAENKPLKDINENQKIYNLRYKRRIQVNQIMAPPLHGLREATGKNPVARQQSIT